MTAANTLITCWTIFAINLIVVSLRILVRLKRKRQSLSIGDYLVLSALSSSLIGYIVFTRALSNQVIFENMTTGSKSSIQGGGEQSARLFAAGLPTLEASLKQSYVSSFFYIFTIWLIKAAFIQFYFEIFPYIKKWLRVALWATTIWTSCGFIIMFFVWLFWCNPRSLNWNPLQQCTPSTEMTPFILLSTLNLTSDVMITLLPLFVLSTLQLRRRENTALIFVFSIGALSIVATIVRSSLIIGVTKSLTPKNTSGMNIMIWSTVEMGAALVAICLPALRVLLWRPEPGITWWGGRSNPNSNSSKSKLLSWTRGSNSKKSQADEESVASSHAKDYRDESVRGLAMYPQRREQEEV